MQLPTRLRNKKVLRDLVRENSLSMDDIIYPIFLVEGEGIRKEISSMKDQYHLSVDQLHKEMKVFKDKGIKALLLFGIPDCKDDKASSAYDSNGIIQKGIRAIKAIDPDMLVITDICLCEYKSDGHCCVFHQNNQIDRAATLDILGKIALSHVEAGADMVAPSDMMDGRIGHIRQVLDQKGYEYISIMAYSAKYASSFYGPFREAAHSAPAFGDRKMYQMDPANSREAIKEMELDIREGADLIMVKPAMPYLDIVYQAKEKFTVPVAAYQVSGEYAMLFQAVKTGLLDKKAIYESLLGIKRSGADIIITYFAKEIKEMLEEV